MAYKSPFSGMFAAAEDEDGSESTGSSGGGYKSSFTGMFAKRKKRDEEAEEAKYSAEQLMKQQEEEAAKKADEEQAERNSKKNWWEKAGDVKRGVGGFVKDAAVDIKDTTVGTWQGLGDVARGERASDALERMSEEEMEMTRRFNDEMNDILGDKEDATQLDAEGKKRWDEYVARSNKERQEFKDRTAAGREQSNEDLDIAEKVDAKKLAFQTAETALNVMTLGITTIPKQVLKQGAKQAIKYAIKTGGSQLVKQTLKEGGEAMAKKAAQEVLEGGTKAALKRTAKTATAASLEGMGYGVTQTGKNNPDADLDDYLLNMAYGAGAGFALPFAGAAVKAGGSKVINKLTGKGGKAVAKAELGTDPSDLNELLNQTIEEQTEKYGTGRLARIKNWVGDQVDPYRALAKIDDKYAKENGIKRIKLNAEDSLEDLARRSAASEREAAGLFFQKTKSGASAADLVKKYKGDSAAGKEFNNYTNMKFLQEVVEKKPNYQLPAGVTKENMAEFIAKYEAKNADAVKDLALKKEINDMAVDYMQKSGAISKKEAQQIKTAYKNAVPLEKIFPEDLERPQVTGRNIGSIAKQTVINKLEQGSDVPISNSFDAMLNRVYKAVSQGNRAKLAQKLLERQQEGLINAKLVVGAGNKAVRMSARDQIREINKGVRYLTKKVSISNRQMKRLDKEINALNIEGLDASLRATRPTVQQPVKTVTVKTVGEVIKDNAPKKLDDLKQSYSIKESLLKEYGPGEAGMKQMAADIHNGGWTQLMELNPKISKSTAMSIASQVLKKPTVKAGKITVTEGKIGRNPSVKSVIKTMLDPAMPSTEILRIQKKIATREPKLAAKLDEILNYKSQIDANKAAKTDLKEVVAEFGDDPTTGKQIISGIIDGEAYKMEVPPDLAKAVMGLDNQKLPSVLKAIAIAKKPFEIAWTGIINPVFTGISFALYDTPMSVINSPQGFRVFGPKAVKESIKSFWSGSDFQKRLAAEGARPYGGSGASSFIKPDAKMIASQRNLLSNITYHATHPEKALSSLDIWGGKLANSTRTRIARAAYDDALRMAKKAGENVDDIAVQKRAMENAALAYRSIMPDYDTMSNLTRQINAVVPFFAASTAGTRAFGKALKRDPLGTGAKALALGIVPTVGVTAYSLASPAGQDFYKDMEASGQKRVLDDNMIIVLPGAHKDDKTGEWTGIIKIPLAPEFRAINQTTWRSVRGAMGGDGPSASNVAWSLFDTVTGGVRSSENPLISTRRILSGEDPRTGERIIKGDMANLPKEEQLYETTSTAGKWVGKVLGTSGIQGDKILSQFGLAGQTARNGGEPVTAVKENVANRFTGGYGESINDSFFKTYSPVKARRDKVSKEVTELVKAGRVKEAKRKASEFNATLPGTFTEFGENFRESEEYDPMFDEMLNGLMIKTSEASFKSRKRQ